MFGIAPRRCCRNPNLVEREYEGRFYPFCVSCDLYLCSPLLERSGRFEDPRVWWNGWDLFWRGAYLVTMELSIGGFFSLLHDMGW